MKFQHQYTGPLQDFSGGPIVEFPPDEMPPVELIGIMSPELWHMGPEWEAIWEKQRGEGIILASLDTGYTTHADGPEIVGTRSFIQGQSIVDGSGHGCILPTDEIYTSNCGLQCIKTFFERMGGLVQFCEDGSVVKGISRFGIQTFSLDVSGNVPKAVRNRVTHVHKLDYDGPVHEVSVNGETITLTPWHPVYIVKSSSGKDRVRVTKKRADELVVGDKVCLLPQNDLSISEEFLTVPFCEKGQVVRQIQIDENFAMLAGLVTTDGHLSNRSVEFTSVKQEHIDLFCELSEKVFGKRPAIYRVKDRAIKANLNLKSAVDCFVYFGVPQGNKSKTMTFPELIAKSPRGVIASFFAGLMEGNGCVTKSQGSKARLISGSREFAYKCCRLLKTLGIRSSVSHAVSDKSKFGRSETWVINIGSWADMLNKLAVKIPFVRTPRKNYCSDIRSIRVFQYAGELYDLTVENSHNYVANGCVVSNTHTIGTMAGKGRIGVAPGAKMLVGKVLSNQGSGGSDGITAGIRWAVDAGAHIISMSLGGGGSYQPTNDAIDYAFSKGCWVNAAAGNAGFNGANTIGWPAKYPGCLCTGAYQRNGSIANFSSGGEQVDWACPGQDIVSFSKNGSGYASMSGTSMATPYGSGVLALLYAELLRRGYPIWKTTDEIRQFFRANMKDVGAPGFDVRFGFGIPVVDEVLSQIIGDLIYT